MDGISVSFTSASPFRYGENLDNWRKQPSGNVGQRIKKFRTLEPRVIINIVKAIKNGGIKTWALDIWKFLSDNFSVCSSLEKKFNTKRNVQNLTNEKKFNIFVKNWTF